MYVKKIFITLFINFLFAGPICRHQLRRGSEYHVSYNLEEAARVFQLIKASVDLSGIQIPPTPVIDDSENHNLAMMKRDEVYARRLQAELDRERSKGPLQRILASVRNSPLLNHERTSNSTLNQNRGHQKVCGHNCDLVTPRECCSCSGRIILPQNIPLCSSES